jgi:hypothetical protein
MRVFDFTVEVEKEGDKLGLDVVAQDRRTLLINHVKSGPVLLWNRAHPELEVQHGDRILEVNGNADSSDRLIALIKSERSLKLLIRRLMEFRVTVHRSAREGRLGIDILQESSALRIRHVGEGPFVRWNAGVAFDLQVRANDRIIEANGIRGSAACLLEEIHVSGPQLDLVLARNEEPPSTRQETLAELESTTHPDPAASSAAPPLDAEDRPAPAAEEESARQELATELAAATVAVDADGDGTTFTDTPEEHSGAECSIACTTSNAE